MLIDLHCHTRKIKSGDGDKREVSDELFVEKIKSSGVEIVAITNHNMFDEDQFIRLQGKIEADCKMWPGVEFDIGYGEYKDRYHLLIVSNPGNMAAFSSAVKDITSGSTHESFIGTIEGIVAKFDPLDCIFMPHFHKTPSIPEDEFAKLSSLLKNPNRLIAEATNVRSMGIFVNHGINCIAGSDIKDWNKYPDMELPELRLRVEEYEHFCKLLDRDPVIVKTLLDKNTPTTYEVYPSKDRDVKEKLRFYKEVNVIFGDKGTGKTEVIKSLVNKFKAEDVPFAKYISGSTKEDLDALLDTSDMERSAKNLGLAGCDDDFAAIQAWGDKSPTPISEYIEFFDKRSAKENQQRIGWSRMSNLSDDADVRLEKVGNDLTDLLAGKEGMADIKLTDYLSDDETRSFKGLLEKLETNIRAKEKAIDTESRATKLVNFTLKKFRDYTAAKTGSPVRPQDTNFAHFANNRFALKGAINKIVSNLAFREAKEYQLLGDIGEKGKIEIEVRQRILNDLPETKSDHKEFGGNITRLREVKEKLRKVLSLVLSISLDDKLVELNDKLEEYEVSSVDDFVGIFKQTVDKDRTSYSPSNGERSIIFIQRALDDNSASIFLLDEPEQSMANSYIDEVIRPRITELGQQKKMVILATHNANLAVRTLPYTTIYRSHDAAGYNTYVGNPFTNRLFNLKDDSDVRDWKETSMKILEGGREAFYDREGIYESGR